MKSTSASMPDGSVGRRKLSICIPTYNRAEYIVHLIDSVLAQSNPDEVEIVICDNHSTDDTQALAGRLARDHTHIRYIRRELNVGFDRNMLEIANYSNADYFWLLGSDDSLTPTAVNAVMQAMENGQPDLILGDAINCDIDMQQTGYLKFLQGGPRDLHFGRQEDVLAFLEACTMTASLFGYISSLVIKRAAWDQVPVSRYTIGSAYPQIFRALDILFRGAGSLHYLAEPIANDRRSNCGYTSEFGEIQRYLIDLRMFRIVIDDYFSTDLPVRNRFKKFVRACFGRLAQEKIRTGVFVMDELLKFFEEDDAHMPEIQPWERYPLAERAYRRFQDNGVLQRYLAGDALLHIGYRHQGEAILKPINERAIGVEPGYSGYDGTRLPFESSSQDAVYASDVFPADRDVGLALQEWFRVLRVGGHLVVSNTLDASSGPGFGIRMSSLLAAIEQALPAASYRVLHGAQWSDGQVAEADIVVAKIGQAEPRPAAQAAPAEPDQAPAPALSAHERVTQALALHGEGKPEQAAALCRQALDMDPKNVTAAQLLGLMAYQAGDHANAVVHFTNALAVNTSLVEAYCNLGCSYAALGAHAEAVQCFSTALSLRPDFEGAENNLAVLRAGAGQDGKAREHFERQLAAHPPMAAARAALDGILSRSDGYRSDPLYVANLDIDRCFADRLDRSGDDRALLQRVLAAYQKASHGMTLCPEVFRPSNLWLPIYKYNLREVIHALETSNIDELNKIYQNFWRDSCSTGLVGVPVDMQGAFFSGSIAHEHRHLYLNDAIHRFRLWSKLLGHRYSLEHLVSPLIGNPYGYYVGDQFIKAGADYQHYYAVRIADLLTDIQGRKVVAEIGGGFGGMAYYLVRDLKNATYIDFDLPENLALTSYYLLKAFPEKKVLLYGEADLETVNLSNYDMVLMPSFQMDKLRHDSCDVVFNSYSLAEMSAETIHHYVQQAANLIKDKGWLFHVNHTKVSLVSARDFPIPDNFTLLNEEFAAWNLGRNQNMDEYEFVYRKNAR